MDELKELRLKIDEIDQRILHLLNGRAKLAKMVGLSLSTPYIGPRHAYGSIWFL